MCTVQRRAYNVARVLRLAAPWPSAPDRAARWMHLPCRRGMAACASSPLRRLHAQRRASAGAVWRAHPSASSGSSVPEYPQSTPQSTLENEFSVRQQRLSVPARVHAPMRRVLPRTRTAPRLRRSSPSASTRSSPKLARACANRSNRTAAQGLCVRVEFVPVLRIRRAVAARGTARRTPEYSQVRVPARDSSAPFYFAIDHCFPVKGQVSVRRLSCRRVCPNC